MDLCNLIIIFIPKYMKSTATCVQTRIVNMYNTYKQGLLSCVRVQFWMETSRRAPLKGSLLKVSIQRVTKTYSVCVLWGTQQILFSFFCNSYLNLYYKEILQCVCKMPKCMYSTCTVKRFPCIASQKCDGISKTYILRYKLWQIFVTSVV